MLDIDTWSTCGYGIIAQKTGVLPRWLVAWERSWHKIQQIMKTNRSVNNNLKRYNWMVLQKGMVSLDLSGIRLPVVEHRCASILIWPEGCHPGDTNTLLTDPCFTDVSFPYAVQLLNSLEISISDIAYYFITHEHLDHQPCIPLEGFHFKSIKFRPDRNKLLSDINAVHCPGHDSNLQALTFRSVENDNIWLVGDAILDKKSLKAWRYYWPNNYLSDEIIETWRSVAKIVSSADIIIPGHGLPFRVTPSLIRTLISQLPNASYSIECKEEIEHILYGRLEKSCIEDGNPSPKYYHYGQITHSEVTVPNIVYTNGSPQESLPDKIAMFFHGKLIGQGVERPALHCASLLHEIVSWSNLCIIMPEFHSMFHKIHEEPPDLCIGSISQKVLESTRASIPDKVKVILIGYSFGCFLLAKLGSAKHVVMADCLLKSTYYNDPRLFDIA